MHTNDYILNIPGIKVSEVKGCINLDFRIENLTPINCPRCGSSHHRKKASYERRIRHESFGRRTVHLLLKAWKYLCKSCSHYFRPPLPGVAKWQRATDAFKEEVCQQHRLGISQFDLSKKYSMSCSTIERWFHTHLQRKEKE